MTPVETPSIVMYLADIITDWTEPKGGPLVAPRPIRVENLEVFADPWIADKYLVKVRPDSYYFVDLVDGESVDECQPTTWPPTTFDSRWPS